MVPSSVPTTNDVGSDAGNAIHVGDRSSVFRDVGGGVRSSRYSLGWESMSVDQVQTTPSVEQEMMLWAFWVPTISRE